MSGLPTAALRRTLRQAPSCTRYASTQASSSSASPASSSTASASQPKLEVQPKQKLPDEKMRVLVSLYHQSASFITKENLSRRIDEAFIDRVYRATSLSAETPFRTLEVELARRRALPKFGQSIEAVAHTSSKAVKAGDTWSDVRRPRETAIKATLYGMLGPGMPAFDALKDEEERIKRQLNEEREKS